MKIIKHLVFWIMLVISAFLTADGAFAQPASDYPTKAIRMIVPFAPGGASDFVARIIQPKFMEELGQQIVIENRAGAGGNIGVEVVARAESDGYTMLLGNVGTMTINPHLYKNFKIKPMQDLIGISAIADLPGGIAVHPSVPVNTVKELIAYAKASPGELNYGSAGVSSAQSLSFEFFIDSVGLNIQHVPYKGGAGAATIGALSGEVKIAVGTMASFAPHHSSGKLKVVGVLAEKRLASHPNLPTLVESGFPELTTASWQGIFVPKGTPRPIVNKLHTALMKVLEDKAVNDRFAQVSAVTIANKSPEDFAVFIKKQTDFWGGLIKRLNVPTM
jgi:tripartite-type tricarboxylate transporter receptor subunit TctC